VAALGLEEARVAGFGFGISVPWAALLRLSGSTRERKRMRTDGDPGKDVLLPGSPSLSSRTV